MLPLCTGTFYIMLVTCWLKNSLLLYWSFQSYPGVSPWLNFCLETSSLHILWENLIEFGWEINKRCPLVFMLVVVFLWTLFPNISLFISPAYNIMYVWSFWIVFIPWYTHESCCHQLYDCCYFGNELSCSISIWTQQLMYLFSLSSLYFSVHLRKVQRKMEFELWMSIYFSYWQKMVNDLLNEWGWETWNPFVVVVVVVCMYVCETWYHGLRPLDMVRFWTKEKYYFYSILTTSSQSLYWKPFSVAMWDVITWTKSWILSKSKAGNGTKQEMEDDICSRLRFGVLLHSPYVWNLTHQ